jgi:DNA-binding transcriptional regulator YhcF (GntR family)
MLLRIDSQLDTPLYAQIAGQLRRSITDGKLRSGERLPAARELADSLDVNLHTVLRAYDELRQEGLLEVRRGRGVLVVDVGPGRARLVELCRALLAEAARQGFGLRDVRRLLGQLS